jgi:regulator of extracellular matrix RemA (YlzA/DUF370 family)
LYFHIGGGIVLQSDELIGIFDMDGATRGKATRNFLRRREKEGRLITAHGDDLPRAFALTASDTAILSPITTETLCKKVRNK